jgi:L-ascorbate metabolism protein UlaG (beta-lactamase superfamily)
MRRRTLALAGLGAIGMLGCAILLPEDYVNPYYDPRKAHHLPAGFRNADPELKLPPPRDDFLAWQRSRIGQSVPDPKLDLSPIAPDLAFIHANRGERSEFAVTWVGHATALIQIGGVNVLTDPIFSQRASPVQWAGPKRSQRPGVALRDLPHIDVVLVSHNHYDHLDADSVKALAAQAGGSPLFVVPLGVERWLVAAGIANVRALDWWDRIEAGGVQVHLVPAQHWSRRNWSDAMRTLWGGFVIEGGGRRAFFAGDTGYSATIFKEIGARFGSIDLAALPIGGYEPRWFMRRQHVDPADAVQMHRDLRARRSLGVHWGTFVLTDEPIDQAVADLAAARTKAGLTEADFFTLRHGETWRASQAEDR